jgi:hypothetical protein
MDDHLDASQKRAEETRSPSFMRLFGELVMLPFTVLVQGMELFIKTIQGMQKVADDGMDVMAGGTTEAPAPAPVRHSDQVGNTTGTETGGVDKDDAATNPKENINMSDKDLSGKDTLKLVRYKILFIKRDYETAFLPEREELVSDSMDATGYTAWKIAEFIQRLAERETRVPGKWDGYPENRNPPALPYRAGDILLGLPEDDKKYLRVYFEVLDRYDREEAKYEQQEIDVLKQIRDRIKV